MSTWSFSGDEQDQQPAAPAPTDAARGQAAPPGAAASRQGRRSKAAEGLLDAVAKQQHAASLRLLSRGSKNHGNGQCRPCVACHQRQGCARGDQCNFCHHTHDASKMLETSRYSVQAQLRRNQRTLAGGQQLPEEPFSSTPGSSTYGGGASSILASGSTTASSDLFDDHVLAKKAEKADVADVLPAEEPCYIATSLSMPCQVLTIKRMSL